MTSSLSGHELKEHNEKIVKCMTDLREQRNELNFLIVRQQEEKVKLQTEVERISYKLTLISKSLAQRVETLSNYDQTIKDAEDNYKKIVDNSEKLLNVVQKEVQNLEELMDKRVGTEQKEA